MPPLHSATVSASVSAAPIRPGNVTVFVVFAAGNGNMVAAGVASSSVDGISFLSGLVAGVTELVALCSSRGTYRVVYVGIVSPSPPALPQRRDLVAATSVVPAALLREPVYRTIAENNGRHALLASPTAPQLSNVVGHRVQRRSQSTGFAAMVTVAIPALSTFDDGSGASVVADIAARALALLRELGAIPPSIVASTLTSASTAATKLSGGLLTAAATASLDMTDAVITLPPLRSYPTSSVPPLNVANSDSGNSYRISASEASGITLAAAIVMSGLIAVLVIVVRRRRRRTQAADPMSDEL